jgi:2'-5' RNA ligase
MTLPDQMTDRWQNRDEPAPGQGVLYWHVLLRDQPEVADLARRARQRLAGFSGLHFTPLNWLHMTTLVAGPADNFSPSQRQQMIQTARELLADTPPVSATLGRIGYHPEAIVLAVTPAEALVPIHEAARTATAQALGNSYQEDQLANWRPHVTICYSTASQRAAPIIDALGLELPSRQIQISALSLVIQHGPERDWNWTTIGTIRLPSPART